MLLKEQRFGVEIELTGISRGKAAEIIAKHFNSSVVYIGEGYQTRTVRDSQNREWKIMRDGSIRPQPYDDEFKVEIVSPILVYDDIETIQEILRELRAGGAKANDSCGIHIHINGAPHNAKSLKNIVNFMCSRQDLIYEALQVKTNRIDYCKKICPELLAKIKAMKNISKTDIETAWYSPLNHGFSGARGGHYNPTRYQCLNLHSYFYRGTVEFRLFNSTTHAGKLKAYIQFCLAVSAWALESSDKIKFNNIDSYNQNQKATIMNNVLTNRLGLVGDEFKTLRYHLTQNLKDAVTVAA